MHMHILENEWHLLHYIYKKKAEPSNYWVSIYMNILEDEWNFPESIHWLLCKLEISWLWQFIFASL